MNQPILAADNCAITNTVGAKNFKTNQRSWNKSLLDKEAIKDLKNIYKTQRNQER